MALRGVLVGLIAFAIFVRINLSLSFVKDYILSSPEFVTPLTSWLSVTEGLTLLKNDISPYSADTIHVTPLTLQVVSWLERVIPNRLPIIFCLLDALTALLLYAIASELAAVHWCQQQRHVAGYSPDAAQLLLKQKSLQRSSLLVFVLYLLNPLVILTCVAQSLSVYHNFLLAASFLAALKGRRSWCLLVLSLAVYESLYPAALLVPYTLCFIHQDVGSVRSLSSGRAVRCIFRSCLEFCVYLSVLMYSSHLLQPDNEWLRSTYVTMLTVPDLSPNLGLFWYFFTEMFEHFRSFFLAVFQFNAFVYSIPLALVLREWPGLAAEITLLLMAVFKSYPSYSDLCLPLALLPCWAHLARYVKNRLVIGVMLLCVIPLAPVLRTLWLSSGSANANFYFAIGLVYCTAQVFLLTDLLFAHLRREFHLKHGVEPLKPGTNEKAEVVLK